MVVVEIGVYVQSPLSYNIYKELVTYKLVVSIRVSYESIKVPGDTDQKGTHYPTNKYDPTGLYNFSILLGHISFIGYLRKKRKDFKIYKFRKNLIV